VTAQAPLLTGPSFTNCTFSELSRGGVGVLREVFYWAAIEVLPGAYDFSAQDAYVEQAARHGLRVLPVLLMAPGFRSSAPATNPKRGMYPPARPKDMGTFAAVLAKRYGPKGTFWRQHPDVPKVPIRQWQIWNEPNLPFYWPRGPNPREYAALLRASARALRHVDRRAEIVTAGLPYSNDRRSMSPETFLRGLYAVGARNAFDTVAVHPYADTIFRMMVAVRRMRRLIVRSGDSGAHLWLTEVGWATGGPPSPFTVSPERQGSLIGQAITRLNRERKALNLRGVVIYNLRDSSPGQGDHDFWGFHAGLYDLAGNPKPALAALQEAAQRVGG